MDDPCTLRKRAARYFENATSAPTPEQAQKLKEIGHQLEMWADDLEEVEIGGNKSSSKPNSRMIPGA
jgi:hypothetical protein